MNNIQFADDKSLVSPHYWCTSRFWQILIYELQPRYYTIVDKLHNVCVSIIDMMLYHCNRALVSLVHSFMLTLCSCVHVMLHLCLLVIVYWSKWVRMVQTLGI